MQVIQNPCNDKINEIDHRFDIVVPARHGGQNKRTRLCSPLHIFKLKNRHRCFAWYQNQLTMFFEMNVCGSLDKVVTSRMHNSRNSSARTRADDHASRKERSARNWSHVVLIVMEGNALQVL